MIVTMLKTAAGPDAVFEAGGTYNLPNAKAKEWLAAGVVKAAPVNAKTLRIPPQPDPEDVPDVSSYDEDEE